MKNLAMDTLPANFCYYCEQNIRTDNLERHVETCQYVLEPCSWKCGLYVPRNIKEKHKLTCTNRQSALSTLTDQGELHNILRTQAKQIKVLENTVIKCFHEIERMKSRNNDVQTLQLLIDQMQQELKVLPLVKQSADTSAHNVKELIRQTSLMQQRNVNNQNDLVRIETQFNKKEKELKEFFTNETEALKYVVNEQKKHLNVALSQRSVIYRDHLQKHIKTINDELADIKKKQEELQKNNKDQTREIANLKRSLAEISLDIEMTECTGETIEGLVAMRPGRFIWKIEDFGLNVNLAKDHEKNPLKSPVFYSRDYGYKIRLLAYPNGFKKWRDRYMVITIQVLKGKFDNLLKWPCKIEANIVLRDCEYDDKPKNFARYITAKRESPADVPDDPQESSVEYLFIPHKELFKSQYSKNDAIFLEVVILKPSADSKE